MGKWSEEFANIDVDVLEHTVAMPGENVIGGWFTTFINRHNQEQDRYQ